ncbi:glyoxylate reductase/hydroxypyruvate reductase-like [Harmonia axyridis]|uniref:glyoxylate reductase/hydroxypyruvate reductase-like n=1 Tax=Harmonia axyridis TaxID=115357 RepID=UPI001E2791CD|nr:glyoxylate reductase/hydroxypyruvate reductase-like [Harmonia axyridis]
MNVSRNIFSKLRFLSRERSFNNNSINKYFDISTSQLCEKFYMSPAIMTKFKVLIVNDTLPTVAVDILKPVCDVIICGEEKSAVLENIAGVDALLFASYDIRIDKNLLEKAGPNLKAVATMSAGYDNIDVEELKRRGIKFGNTPGVVGSAVAEQAIMLALAASRRLNEARSAIESSEWSYKFDARWLMGMEISGSVVGIVGLGSIGQNIVRKLGGFDVKQFLYTGRKPKPEGEKLKAQFVSLDQLTQESDFIFSCLPLTEHTRNIFDYDRFSKMKKTAVFVNVGRGGSVNQPDLVKALRENSILAAGLDVMTPEPLDPNDDLLKLQNCVLAPHLGTSTWKTTEKMAELAANNILKALKGEPMLTPVV